MVAEAAEIARADVGAEEFLSVIGLVVLQHEVGMEDSGTTLLIMKPLAIIHHAVRNDDLVEDLPVGLVLQSAFETEALVLPEQVDETTLLHLRRMPCMQHVVDTGVGGAVVQVAHHDDFRLVSFGRRCHDGIDLGTKNSRRTRTRAYRLQLAAVAARPVVDENVDGVTL